MFDFKKWFDPRSEEKIAKEREAYQNKVFPFGDAQKEKIQEVLKQLINGKYEEINMFNYLVVRQNIENYYDDNLGGINSDGLSYLYSSIKKTVKRKDNDDRYVYIALAEYDYKIDENLNYDIDAIKKSAEEIKKILTNS